MACACTQKKTSAYKWTSADGSVAIEYDTEIQAKAKVLRKGGSYVPVPKAG